MRFSIHPDSQATSEEWPSWITQASREPGPCSIHNHLVITTHPSMIIHNCIPIKIIYAWVIHKITFTGVLAISVHNQDQHTPSIMLITSYPCKLLHQKHAYHPHSLFTQQHYASMSHISMNHMLAIEINHSSMYRVIPFHVPCTRLHSWNIHPPNLKFIVLLKPTIINHIGIQTCWSSQHNHAPRVHPTPCIIP